MRIEKQRLKARREHIDGNDYVDCHFDDVSLIYSGGDLPEFTRCEFTTIRVFFEGPAQNTLVMLQAMAEPASGFEPIFSQMFPKRPYAG